MSTELTAEKTFIPELTLTSPDDYDTYWKTMGFIVFVKDNEVFTFDSVNLSFDSEHPAIAGKKVFGVRDGIIIVECPGGVLDSTETVYKLYIIGAKHLINRSFSREDIDNYQITYSCCELNLLPEQSRAFFLVLLPRVGKVIEFYNSEKSQWYKCGMNNVIGKHHLYRDQLYYIRAADESALWMLNLTTGKKYLIKDFGSYFSSEIYGIDNVLFFGRPRHGEFFFYDAEKGQEIELSATLPNVLLPVYSVYSGKFYFIRDDGLYTASGKRIAEYYARDTYNAEVLTGRLYEIYTGTYSQWRRFVDLETGQIYKSNVVNSNCYFNAIFGKPIAKDRLIFYSLDD